MDLIFLAMGMTFSSARALRMRRWGAAALNWMASSPAIEWLDIPVIRTGLSLGGFIDDVQTGGGHTCLAG